MRSTQASSLDATPPKLIKRELLGVYCLSLVITASIVGLGSFVEFLHNNALALVALVFLYFPLWVLRRREIDPSAVGLTSRGALRGSLFGLACALVVLPFFWLGFHAWERIVFDHRLEVRLDNYRIWPDELRNRPDMNSEGLFLWRSQRHLHLAWNDEREWLIELQSDGILHHIAGTVPNVFSPDRTQRQLESSPDSLHQQITSSWLFNTPAGQYQTVFYVEGGNFLRITPSLQNEPLSGDRIWLGRSNLSTNYSPPLTIERGVFWIVLWVVVQLFLVSLPEEFFYRGYLQTHLASLYPGRWKLGPFHTSFAIIITSAAFALGHFVIGFDPQRLAVFFPSLAFGWLRDYTNGLAAPIVFHAACNLMVQLTVVHYWPA